MRTVHLPGDRPNASWPKTPHVYLGVTIPENIKAEWRRWAAAEWRKNQHFSRARVYPPDQRFSVKPATGMCRLHREHWFAWRDRWFKGRRFLASPIDMGINRFMRPEEAWDFGRAEWDDLTIEQMRAVEDLCLSGRSVQCEGPRIGAGPDIEEMAS